MELVGQQMGGRWLLVAVVSLHIVLPWWVEGTVLDREKIHFVI